MKYDVEHTSVTVLYWTPNWSTTILVWHRYLFTAKKINDPWNLFCKFSYLSYILWWPKKLPFINLYKTWWIKIYSSLCVNEERRMWAIKMYIYNDFTHSTNVTISITIESFVIYCLNGSYRWGWLSLKITGLSSRSEKKVFYRYILSKDICWNRLLLMIM